MGRKKKLPQGVRLHGDRYEARKMVDGRRMSAYGKTPEEALENLETVRLEDEAKTEAILFRDWTHTWLTEYKEPVVKRGTLDLYNKELESLILPTFGKRELREIKGVDVQKFYNDLSRRGYALGTIKVCSAILSGIFKQAFRNELIEKNPVPLAVVPKTKEPAQKRQALTKEQQALFLRYCTGSYLEYLFNFMLRTGTRSGEARGLRYSDMDKKVGVLHITRQLKYTEGSKFYIDTPKSKTSTRDIPLTDDIISYIERQHAANAKRFKIQSIKEDRFLFCTPDGKPLSRERVQFEIDRVIAKIRADGHDFPRITSHVFRHTFATRAIEAGMSPQVLKAILGHSTLAMTMDLYAHVLPDAKSAEMRKIADAF